MLLCNVIHSQRVNIMVGLQKLFLISSLVASTQCISNLKPSIQKRWLLNPGPSSEPLQLEEDAGVPLLLTPLIEEGNIEEARNLSAVGDIGIDGFSSYSGYFTVNPEHNGNMFFWYFPAKNNPEDAPVLLWLQGGPGSASLFALFMENGPFRYTVNDTLEPNIYSWHLTHNLIYIDNPVGTGYSFTELEGYVISETEVGRDLYAALVQFFTMFPELQKNDFFISGESYAGKFVPAVAYTIHQNNPTADLKINLKGLAIGNGFSDPVNILNVGEYLYQIGIVDGNTKDEIQTYEQEGKDAIANERWLEAFTAYGQAFSTFSEASGGIDEYNYLGISDGVPSGDYVDFVQLPEIRRAIHVGNQTYVDFNYFVYAHLEYEFMQSVKPWVEVLVDNYRVMYYSGQLDVICAYPLTERFYQTLNFSAAEEYRNAKRSIWYVGDDLAGYVKTAGNFTEVLVRNAGHMVPADKPAWALDLITKFTSNEPLTRKESSKVF